ncbi:NAD(P)/FAD-dependent oxidoreductase [Staphylococcus chromogenes]|uniref:NAD(P)/FAD-dependent oxidoreductase n=1 Tax=Staphylococcus chromogenes TaxID=46126 RepID=UPI000D19E87A|nr:NAD(P)/FAD-dependent oxidoreductase [Staphylococcus chromogenes]PTG90747.1 thioredoxin reductase [Staphylococcus chromogenes]WAG31003.1 NAD(P)/FAD-dependent oxidoreductase [Staphylococcus chromogenes]
MKDVTIIGGGPAGLYASFYAGLRGMDVQIIDAQEKLGGKMRLYPEKIIWDIGGVAPKTCEAITQDIIEQGLHFNPEVILEAKVTDIRKMAEHHFEVVTESGKVYTSKSVIIAIGAGIIKPQRLEIEHAHRFELTNLHYVVPRYEHFRGKNVLISGGGNTALDWAEALAPIAQSVTLVYRRNDVSGHEATMQNLKSLKVKCHSNMMITDLESPSNASHLIEKVTLTHLFTGEKIKVQADEVIISHGFDRQLELLNEASLKINMVDHTYIQGHGNSKTNIDGVFACGDILQHPAKIHLITSAFSDAGHAANSAKNYISPQDPKEGYVSSHNPVFKQANKAFLPK